MPGLLHLDYESKQPMSRAFTKEPDGDMVADDAPERPRSEHPNYVTPAGLAALEARHAGLAAERAAHAAAGLQGKPALAHAERALRYLDARIGDAIVVDPAACSRQNASALAGGRVTPVVNRIRSDFPCTDSTRVWPQPPSPTIAALIIRHLP